MSEILTCPWCNKPRATRADWERYEGGEGTHLCWADPRCEMDGDEEIVVVLRAALARETERREKAERERDESKAQLLAVKELHVKGGRLDAVMSGEIARELSLAFVEFYRQQGGQNYVELGIADSKTGERFTVLVQRVDGLSPHEARRAAESERDRLRERLDQFEAYAITVSSALADRAYIEALGNDLVLTRGAMAADDARLRAAAIRVWGEDVHGCDTPDAMADLIESLRSRLDALSHLGTGAGRRAG